MKKLVNFFNCNRVFMIVARAWLIHDQLAASKPRVYYTHCDFEDAKNTICQIDTRPGLAVLS